MTFNPSDNIAFANCLASTSVGNPFVILGKGAYRGDPAAKVRYAAKSGSRF
jgi:hypothetical protein